MKKLIAILITLLTLTSCLTMKPDFVERPNAVKIGMTTTQVKAVWEQPNDINTIRYDNYYHEQWVYRHTVYSSYYSHAEVTYLYFENGKLTAIQNS